MSKPSASAQEGSGLKLLKWEGSSKNLFDKFPDPIKHDAGFQLYKVQRGDEPASQKPVPAIGSGVMELIVDGEEGWYRVFFVVKFEDAVHVLHVIKKKTNKAPVAAIALARERYNALAERYRRAQAK